MASQYFKRLLAITVCILSLTGCDQNPFAKALSLERTVKDQNVRIEAIEKELKDAKWKLILLEHSTDQYKSATFDPSADEGFGRIDSSIGTFAVSIQDIKPHADGVKVRLHVGNLTSAIVSGGSFKAKWGRRMPKADSENDVGKYIAWQEQLQEKDGNFTEELRPGTWNSLTLSLPSIPPEQFGYLELSIDSDQIKLLTGK